MLHVCNLNAGYGSRIVIRNVDLEVRAGEIVALIGANGAGKSTLAHAISGLLTASSGEIVLEGCEIQRLTVAQRLQRGLVHVPEGRQIFGSLTVQQNLELGTYARGYLSRAELKERLCQAYARFPMLAERSGHLAGNLSGGQQQTLAIARGLLAEPRLLILDEPSLGLSPILVREMFELIAALRGDGVAILLAEQNVRISLTIADRAYVMENGRVTLHGPAQLLKDSEDIAARYLGLGVETTRKRFDVETRQRLARLIQRMHGADAFARSTPKMS